jgi:hypothetical protein
MRAFLRQALRPERGRAVDGVEAATFTFLLQQCIICACSAGFEPCFRDEPRGRCQG